MSADNKTMSKYLSLILRHKPETIGLSLDANGWAQVDELLAKSLLHKVPLTLDKLRQLVETNNKKRFVFSSNGQQIRASQGHSIAVDLQLNEAVPPARLYHGTALLNIGSIKTQGLLKGQRHHVHLSTDQHTANSVGQRYGKPVVLGVDAEHMYKEGFTFYCSDNGVWLVDHVPARYLDFNPTIGPT
jgi:putative RNA 2'-phosphotransferase